ncbi:DNA primase [Changpingibacter yushuensis]|uniref:DNA primase n=1 Tax=Changpingibacter yushuensis TaxID=2758440 RepID=UPI0015F43C1A|nr:DNA primase [Changpingibacter yushuensis]
MPGLIRREDIDEVRARIRIDDVVSGYVALRTAGMDSMKGLCPFHDEKTPSFHVRPNVGRWHCFGCGEGGDAISFIEKVEHISFVEAVELLARKANVQLHYEEDGRTGPRDQGGPSRARLIDAHRVAMEFYIKQLHTPDAQAARTMLAERGFDDAAIAHYQIGYSPDSWDSLLRELRNHGFSEREISVSGLATQGNRGMYDRFRGRVMWPIFSITGDPIGFGARRLKDDDNGPKYLNTPETPIYKKSQVLYGLNLAKKAISQERRVVVVEGYTDVMAAQLAGIECAVATCGTAFGTDHVKIVRRLIGDGADPAAGVMLSNGKSYGGEVVFTFDGDAAGQKAALRAFQEDQSFAAQTFVAVAENGMDPCEVRMTYGDEGVRQVVAARRPLFEFAIQSALAGLPLNTAEGRTAGLRAAAPMVASIRDRVLRGEYTRQLAGWLGMDEVTVRMAVKGAARHPQARRGNDSQFGGAGSQFGGAGSQFDGARQGSFGPAGAGGPAGMGAARGAVQGSEQQSSGSQGGAELPREPVLRPRNQLRDPIERVEREALEVYLQVPWYAADALMDQLPPQTFQVPIHASVHDAIRATGGTQSFTTRFDELREKGLTEEQARRDASSWYIERVLRNSDPIVARAVNQLVVEDLPENRQDRMRWYSWSIAMALIRQGITRQIADVRSELQRTPPADERYSALFARLIELENQRRACDEQIETPEA